jgi:hypothetical protein
MGTRRASHSRPQRYRRRLGCFGHPDREDGQGSRDNRGESKKAELYLLAKARRKYTRVHSLSGDSSGVRNGNSRFSDAPIRDTASMGSRTRS